MEDVKVVIQIVKMNCYWKKMINDSDVSDVSETRIAGRGRVGRAAL